jgi:hypothetical protein
MQIEPLSLAHQHLLEPKFQQLNLPLSEYSFANLYLFRQLHQYQVIQLNGETFIQGLTRDKVPFIMLTSPPSLIPSPLLERALSRAQILFPVPEDWLRLLDKWLVQASFKEEDSDYLYTTTKLAHYPGRHLSSKRNLVKQLLTHHEVRSENVVQQLRDAQEILENWLAEHSEMNHQADYSSCLEALEHFDRLHLHGQIVYVNQKPAGFVIGEWLGKDDYAVHFSKASRSIKGLYQYLFQKLAQSLEGTYSWINLEQDLGIPSIRYSKLSYQPDLLVKKWRVQLHLSL